MSWFGNVFEKVKQIQQPKTVTQQEATQSAIDASKKHSDLLNTDITSAAGGSYLYGDWLGNSYLQGADGETYLFVPKDTVNKGVVVDAWWKPNNPKAQVYNQAFLTPSNFDTASQYTYNGTDGFVWKAQDAIDKGIVKQDYWNPQWKAYVIDDNNPAISGIGYPTYAPGEYTKTPSYVAQPKQLTSSSAQQIFIPPTGDRLTGSLSTKYVYGGWLANTIRDLGPAFNVLTPILLDVFVAPGTGSYFAIGQAMGQGAISGDWEKGIVDAAKIYAIQQGSTAAGNYVGAEFKDYGSIAQSIMTNGAANAVQASLLGRDPVKGFIDGGLSGAVSSAARSIEGFSNLPVPVQKMFGAGMAGVLQGKSKDQITDSVMLTAIRSGLESMGNAMDANKYFQEKLGREPTAEELNKFTWYTDRTQMQKSLDNYSSVLKYADKNGVSLNDEDVNKILTSADPVKSGTDTINNTAATNKGFYSYADMQAAGGDKAADFYAKKEGYADAIDKVAAQDAGYTSPTDWKNYQGAVAAGFDDYTQQQNAKAIGASSSSEYKEKIGSVNSEFNKYLGRDATPEEMQAVIAGGANVASTTKNIIEPKYTDEQEVKELIRNELGREATPEEISKYVGAKSNIQTKKDIADYANPLKTTEDEVIKFFQDNIGRDPTAAEVAKFVGYTPDKTTLTQKNVEDKLINGLDLPEDYKFLDLKSEVKFADAFKANREAFGPGYVFEWTNPKTGVTSKYTTNNEAEEAVAAQNRVDQLPAFGGSRNTQTGRPESATENIYVDKKTGDIINDTRVWDEQGNVISGSLQTNYESPTVTEATKALSNAIKTGLDVGSGVIKGGADVIGQVGVLGALIGVADPSNLLTKTADQIRASVDSMRSTDFKNNEALMYDAIAKAGNDGFFAQLVETGKQFGANPAQTAEFISRNGVSLLVGTGAMTTFRALGAGMTAAEAATIGSQAALQGASVAEEAYKDAIKNGKTDAEALNAARVAGAIGSATSYLSNKFIPGALSNEQRLAGEAVAKNSVSAALRGEISSELSEEVSGKIAGNIAAGNPWDKDLGSTAVQAVIGSGAVTGLAHVGTIGNVDTAVAIAEDAGATPDDIKQIKSYSSSSLGTNNYGSDQQLNESIQRLQDYGLSEAEAKQVGGKLYESSVDEKVTSYLESQGVAADKAAELSKNITADIVGGMNAPDAINSIASQLTDSTGLASLDAKLATNKFLTGTDVTKEVNDTLSKYNYSATPEQIANMISANAVANKGELTTNVVSTKVSDILTNSGLSGDVASSLAPTIANSVLTGEGLDTSVKLVADQIAKATGQDPLTASIIANEALTGSNLKTDINSQLEAMGYKPTQQEINDLISQNLATQKTDLGTKIEEYVDPRFVNQQEALAALNANLATQITPSQLNMLIGQYNESELPQKAIASVLAGNIAAEQEAEAEKQRQAALAEKAKLFMTPPAAPSSAAAAKQFGQPNVPTQTPSTSPLAAAGMLTPTFLSSKGVQEKFQGPLEEFQRLQNEPFAGENQYEGIAPNEPTQEQTPMNDAYYNYGQNPSIDDIMSPRNVQNTTNPDWLNAANQEAPMQPSGLVANMYAAGGITGTRHGKYAHGGLSTPLMAAGGKLRVDFRHGDAVTGEGDGQSDDIPAMLADGEFVFPADVVAAIGNGSTKAGSDKLYDMMHGIRAHVRSAKPQDLPPEIKSPLDFLKTKPRKAGRK